MKIIRKIIVTVVAVMFFCTAVACKTGGEAEKGLPTPPNGGKTTDDSTNHTPSDDGKEKPDNVDSDENGEWLEIKFPRK